MVVAAKSFAFGAVDEVPWTTFSAENLSAMQDAP